MIGKIIGFPLHIFQYQCYLLLSVKIQIFQTYKSIALPLQKNNRQEREKRPQNEVSFVQFYTTHQRNRDTAQYTSISAITAFRIFL